MKTILVVDDEVDIREFEVKVLMSQGFERLRQTMVSMHLSSPSRMCQI